MKLYEIQFTVKVTVNKEDHSRKEMFALIGATDQANAIRIALNAWGPPGEITNIQIREIQKYFMTNAIEFSDGEIPQVKD